MLPFGAVPFKIIIQAFKINSLKTSCPVQSSVILFLPTQRITMSPPQPALMNCDAAGEILDQNTITYSRTSESSSLVPPSSDSWCFIHRDSQKPKGGSGNIPSNLTKTLRFQWLCTIEKLNPMRLRKTGRRPKISPACISLNRIMLPYYPKTPFLYPWHALRQ